MGTLAAAIVRAVAVCVSEPEPSPVAVALEARLPDIESLQRELSACSSGRRMR